MELYKTNVFGLINVTTAMLPYMRTARSGTIVMIGSRMSWQPNRPVSDHRIGLILFLSEGCPFLLLTANR